MKGVGIFSLVVFCFFTLNTAVAQKIDPKKSELEWVGEKVAGKHNGKVSLKSGELDLKKKTGEFVVDMQTITVEDLSGDLKERLTNHLRSDDFFSVEKNKTATLKIKSMESTGKDKYKASGDLTIKGITKPVTFTLTDKKGSYEGEMVFDRTHYDIKYNSGSFFQNLGDKLIKDQVHLKFKLVPAKA